MDKLKAYPLPKECQYCEHFEMSNGDAVCEKGHTILMYCNGKDFELDLFIAQALSRTQPENKPMTNFDHITENPEVLAGEINLMCHCDPKWQKDFLNWLNEPEEEK